MLPSRSVMTSMSRRAAAGVTLCLVLVLSGVQASPRSPHLIFIVADDLGWNDVGYHNPDIISPTIDDLAGSGIKLNQSYVQPLCSPVSSDLTQQKPVSRLPPARQYIRDSIQLVVRALQYGCLLDARKSKLEKFQTLPLGFSQVSTSQVAGLRKLWIHFGFTNFGWYRTRNNRITSLRPKPLSHVAPLDFHSLSGSCFISFITIATIITAVIVIIIIIIIIIIVINIIIIFIFIIIIIMIIIIIVVIIIIIIISIIIVINIINIIIIIIIMIIIIPIINIVIIIIASPSLSSLFVSL
ncbi:arylsulfatase B [Elysia marginata]|uniref:Arylsulfatase B n=1 Tax=Elysia marginata TaxID=1093978 RepID=A0AAV4GL53_9GAST|nr:arylsulfatase B [Elysia marginata]